MKYRVVKKGAVLLSGDEYLHKDGSWVPSDSNGLLNSGWTKYRRPLKKKVAEKQTHNTQMAAALWRELKRRQSNGLIPLRVYWVAVTEKRLNAAVAALPPLRKRCAKLQPRSNIIGGRNVAVQKAGA